MLIMPDELGQRSCWQVVVIAPSSAQVSSCSAGFLRRRAGAGCRDSGCPEKRYFIANNALVFENTRVQNKLHFESIVENTPCLDLTEIGPFPSALQQSKDEIKEHVDVFMMCCRPPILSH